MRHQPHIIKLAARVLMQARDDARAVPKADRTPEMETLTKMRIGPIVFLADVEGRRE